MKEISGPPREQLRRLSEEDVELWLGVTRGVARRPGAVLPEPHRTQPDKPAETEAPRPTPPAPSPAQSRRPALPSLEPLERRARQRLARGMTAVDAAIDLHGMRQHEAHIALHGFLGRAQRNGAKIVLVVTGKGDARPAEGFDTGVLRRSVPLWLRAPEWRGLVVGFEEATRSHGGSGALYVRIRRQERRKG
ncbi:MAG TPA: Smr/MutS family protein [Methylovirgula sp.]|nr:Smr/MutS family protein [Methylovirgula sp.]